MLGPLLFIIYINDIVQDIDAQIKLFADDTSLYLVVDDPIETAETLNGDFIDKIHIWSEKWLVKFNPQKTETMILSRKNNKPNHPPLKMNNSELQKVDNHKHLGVIFSNNGFWHDHVDYIVKQSYTQLNMLRKVRMTLDIFSLEKIYMSFIRRILEYADVIWDSQNQSLINKLENVLLDDARIVTEGTKLTGFNKLYEETKWKNIR